MGREIKFRAWNGNQMFYVKHGADLQLNFGINDGWSLWEPYGEICYHKNGELMQYTGLKDKNGKEIYEGDIVNHGSEHHYTGVIIFEDGCFGTQEFHMDDVVPCEVIGNIYEHPHLLESQ